MAAVVSTEPRPQRQDRGCRGGGAAELSSAAREQHGAGKGPGAGRVIIPSPLLAVKSWLSDSGCFPISLDLVSKEIHAGGSTTPNASRCRGRPGFGVRAGLG